MIVFLDSAIAVSLPPLVIYRNPATIIIITATTPTTAENMLSPAAIVLFNPLTFGVLLVPAAVFTPFCISLLASARTGLWNMAMNKREVNIEKVISRLSVFLIFILF